MRVCGNRRRALRQGLGRTSEAIVLATEALRRPTVPPMARVFLSAWRAAIEGDRDAALASVQQCLRGNFLDPEGIYRLGWILARLHEDAFALQLLQRAVSGGFTCPFHLSTDPWFEGIRPAREFTDLLVLAQEKQTMARAALVALRGDQLLHTSSTVAASGATG